MLVRALKIQLTEGQTLVGALNALLTQKWVSSVINGHTVLSTSEAGGSVTFTFERAYTPAELAVMAEEALEWVNTLVNPENPPLDLPRYNRIHPTFHKSVLWSPSFVVSCRPFPSRQDAARKDFFFFII